MMPQPPSPPFAALPPGTSVPRRALLAAKRALKQRGLPLLAAAYGRPGTGPARRLHVYGVGTPKSGTHSLANLFRPAYRAAHEPQVILTKLLMARWLEGGYTEATAERLLRARDRWLGLDVEAAHYLHHAVGLLVRLFPEARFVLTIRDPYTWLTSEVNQSIQRYRDSHPNRAVRMALSDYRYGRHGLTYSPEEAALRRFEGVYPVGSYLAYWTEHNQRVLDAVPPERLFVLRTSEIKARRSELARFVGADPDALSVEGAHAFARPIKHVEVHEVVRPEYLEEAVRRRCGTLLERFFPEIRSLDDALRRRPAPSAA